jgi:hypothetical protein
MSAFGRLACLVLGASMALAAPVAATAGQANAEVAVPRVTVPHVPVPAPAGGVAGCWSAQRPIYGPYSLSFCSNGRYGSYQVRGGGLSCNGSVNVTPNGGGTVTVRLSRSRCNGWTDWSADYLVCRNPGPYWAGGYRGGFNRSYTGGTNPEVAVPHVPSPRVPTPHVPNFGRLDCTYYPVAAGYHPTGLALTRY